MTKSNPSGSDAPVANPAPEPQHRPVSPAAARALAEAQARRAQAGSKPMPKEMHGRDGLEPTRYGDWEVKGIASDF